MRGGATVHVFTGEVCEVGHEAMACDTDPMLSRLGRATAATLRLSDAERERAIGALKAHYAEGRLSIGELEARVEQIYRSGTRRDVATPLRDLPLRGVGRLILDRVQRFQRALLRTHVVAYAAANASLLCLWELTGQGFFWPAVFLVPSTVVLGAHAVASRSLTRALDRFRW